MLDSCIGLRFSWRWELRASGPTTINILVVIAAAAAGPSLERTHKAFIAALYIAAGIVIVQFAFFAIGLPFPTFLLNNNPDTGL